MDGPLDRAQAQRVLDLLGGHAHLEAIGERQDLLRFARSAPTYQHSEERLLARIRLVRDGRSAWGTLTSLEDESVLQLRGRLDEVLRRLQPGGAELARDAGLEVRAATCYGAHAAADADARAELLDRIGAALAGAELGGSIADAVSHHAVANSTGLYRAETRTRSTVQLIAAKGGASSFAKLFHRDRDALLAEFEGALGRLRGALVELPAVPLPVGRHRAVLGPQALAGVVAPFAYEVFNGRAVAAGESAASGGAALGSERITLVDDGGDEAGLPSSFDCEGVAKRRVPLLERGLPIGAVHDTASARETGSVSTGHAVPPAWRFGSGPSPSHLVVAAGSASDDELIAACHSGLYLERVDYVRVVQPRTTLATGLSRNGTLRIENGVVIGRVPQFRFTVELAELLRGVELLGARRERGELPFLESIAAPGAVVAAFPVDALT